MAPVQIAFRLAPETKGIIQEEAKRPKQGQLTHPTRLFPNATRQGGSGGIPMAKEAKPPLAFVYKAKHSILGGKEAVGILPFPSLSFPFGERVVV